jgi:hypothetical protein
MKTLRCMSLVLSIFLLAGCGASKSDINASKSDINDCVRYNIDRVQEREFAERQQRTKGAEDAMNNLARAVGSSERTDYSGTNMTEAREIAAALTPVLKKKCTENVLYIEK